jgi:hypothetical protein
VSEFLILAWRRKLRNYNFSEYIMSNEGGLCSQVAVEIRLGHLRRRTEEVKGSLGVGFRKEREHKCFGRL